MGRKRLPPPIEIILPGSYRHVTALFTTNKGGLKHEVSFCAWSNLHQFPWQRHKGTSVLLTEVVFMSCAGK